MKQSIIKIYYSIGKFSLYLFNILLGFFLATIISTIPAHTADSGVIAASILISISEIISKLIYNKKNFAINIYCKWLNCLKMGIIYGLFVDAFKLGS
uniref:hypothetical protein n=1 Tax=Glaucosphaera vacuolata TaxID=38265 RepID=UPI001FCD9AF2|nr:hypothetical protein MW444_pgp161 [Glaucosphaera vacuolata]UNJ18599.1 hypothetical protein [Glaucosphaera vacuolata]